MANVLPPPDGYLALRPESQAGRVGCLFLVAALLLVPGTGLLVLTFVSPAGEGNMWVMPLVGAAFTLVGGVLLYAGIKGARGARIAGIELFVEQGASPRPGAVVKLRVRQPGPMHIDSLRLNACCERVYQRRVKPNSSSTVEDQEVVWEQILMDLRDEDVPRGSVLERDVLFAIPHDVPPTGPARPDGRIRWQLKSYGDAGVMRATYSAFEVRVLAAPLAAGEGDARSGGDRTPPNEWSSVFPGDSRRVSAAGSEAAEAAPAAPGPTVRPRGMPRRPRRASSVSFNAGCLMTSVPFLFGGLFFSWVFFSGAAFHGRGNPYMALFAGLLFGGIGLVGTAAGVANIVGSWKKTRVQSKGPAGSRSRRPPSSL